MIIVLCILIFLILYNYSGLVRGTIETVLLPSSYKKFSFLYENKTQSEDYEIKKIIHGESYENILLNTLNHEFIIEIVDSDYDRHNAGWTTFWKVNKRGEVIDSLNTRSRFNETGVIFEENYYIDWVNLGEKEKQKYQEVVNFDSITASQFKVLVNKANNITYDSDYKNETVNCYIESNKNWIVLKSKKGFEDDFYSKEEKFFKYSNKSNQVLLSIENSLKPFHGWKDKRSFINIEKFVSKSRETKSFYDINNTSRSGWHGVGYFKFSYKSSVLYFKTYTFKSSSFGMHPDIRIYNVDIPDISFVIKTISNRKLGDRYSEESGVYVVTKKEK